MAASITMKVRKDGWVSGSTNGFDFTALVYSEASEYGINNGRISKLTLTQDKETAVKFDRKWEKEAETKAAFTTYLKVVTALDSLPV